MTHTGYLAGRVEIFAETADPYGVYPRLTEEQRDRLRGRGQTRKLDEGTVLYRPGEVLADLLVVESGLAAVVDADDRTLAVLGPGRLLGDLGLLTGQSTPDTARMVETGEVLAVPADDVRDLARTEPALGDTILRGFLQRRWVLLGLGAGLRIIGSRFDPHTRRLRDFAARNRLAHRWTDLEEDAAADALLAGLGVAPEETPVVIWSGEKVLRNPSNAELARAIGGGPPSFRDTASDLAVVGAGPAGLAATVSAASEGLSAVLLDAVATGGQAATSSRIQDYLGFPDGVRGDDLAHGALSQAERFGATVCVPAQVVALEGWDGRYTLRLADGPTVRARTVLIATGARYHRLDVPDLARFEPTCVYYAATAVEAQVCRGVPVVIVGGGNSAGQAAVFLAGQAERVRLLIRGGDLGENMSRYLVDRIARTPGIEVLCHTEVRAGIGEDTLTALAVVDNRTGAETRIPAAALFVFVGADPNTAWLGGGLTLDRQGFVLTGPGLGHLAGDEPGRPFLLETSLPAVFAAGDVRSGSIKRVASAAGEGAMAVRFIHEIRGT